MTTENRLGRKEPSLFRLRPLHIQELRHMPIQPFPRKVAKARESALDAYLLDRRQGPQHRRHGSGGPEPLVLGRDGRHLGRGGRGRGGHPGLRQCLLRASGAATAQAREGRQGRTGHLDRFGRSERDEAASHPRCSGRALRRTLERNASRRLATSSVLIIPSRRT